MYFWSNGKQFNLVVDEPRIGLFKYDSFTTLFHEEKPREIDDKKEESVIDMLRQILKYEPEKRPSAEELLSHPWFADNGA